MTLEDENNSYTGGIATGLGDDADDSTGGSGGDAMTSGPVFLLEFGSAKTPMYFKSVLTLKTTAVSPYGNFLDVSSKEQKLLWREMVKPDANVVPLKMTVTNSKAIIDLFTDKVITFRWIHFMRIPLHGEGVAGPIPNKTPSGRMTYNITLSVFKNLIEDTNHLTLDDVMAFASRFMGDLSTPCAVRPHNNMTMKFFDTNALGNNSFVACYKE